MEIVLCIIIENKLLMMMMIIYFLYNTDNYYHTHLLKTHFNRKFLMLSLDFCDWLLMVLTMNSGFCLRNSDFLLSGISE